MSESIDFQALKKLWEDCAKTQDTGPSSGMATMGTFRWLVAKNPDATVNPTWKPFLDDPAISDSTWVEFYGESLFVRGE
jgi:hypothetical protein